MSDERLLTIKELKQLITKNDTGLLFCFGTSLISRIIQAKTKLNNKEVVPSHVAIIYQGKFLYESTSQPQEYKNKTNGNTTDEVREKHQTFEKISTLYLKA